MPLIDRGFERIETGLVHYRQAGEACDAPPLVLIHGGPGSSAGLVPMIAKLAEHRRVIAPDLPGNGDSDALREPRTSILLYANAILEFLDALDVEQFDLYGHHSGAQIACEISIARPANVRRMILDGVALFSPEQRCEFAAQYAPRINPQMDGAHLLWIWDFARNLTRFFPHYRRDDASRLNAGTVVPADVVTSIAADLLKVWPTYHLLYAAAFEHDLAERLPRVVTPTLLLQIGGDPLAQYVHRAADLVSDSRIIKISRDERPSVINSFLNQVMLT